MTLKILFNKKLHFNLIVFANDGDFQHIFSVIVLNMQQVSDSNSESEEINDGASPQDPPVSFNENADSIPTVTSRDRIVTFSKEADNVNIEIDHSDKNSKEDTLSQTVRFFKYLITSFIDVLLNYLRSHTYL